MSTVEEKLLTQIAAPERKKEESFLSAFLRLACSVRLGVTLLCLLGLACLIGMLIMQQSVDGFENYYAALTPAQRLLYGKLGLFNIYHAWYFNALICLVSISIILASIDRFPKTWKYVSKPQVTVPLRWLEQQKLSSNIESDRNADALRPRVESLLTKYGWKKIRAGKSPERLTSSPNRASGTGSEHIPFMFRC